MGDYEREFQLKAALGEIDTEVGIAAVEAMNATVDSWRDRDPELYETLMEGNRRHPERVNEHKPGWVRDDIDPDPETMAAFDVLVADPVEDEARELRLAYEAGLYEDAGPRDTRDNRRRSSVTTVTTVTSDSPVPLTRTAAQLPVFPVEVFPDWMRDHIEGVATFTQTPVDLGATVALAALATAAAGRVQVEIRGQWVEPCNLFTVSALPPGSRKSAVYKAITRPIYLAEKGLVDEIEPTILEAETMLAVESAKLKRTKDQAARADTTESEEHRDAAKSLAELVARMEEEIPPRPRLVADDITPEAAASLLAEQGGRLGVLSAEGGIFQILAGRYSSGVSNLDLFLKGHAGDPLRVDRRSHAPLIVDSPALTMGLTVQPEVLKTISEMPGFRGRGLLGRILYSMPANTVGYRQVGVEAPPDEIGNRYEVRLSDLARLFFQMEESVTVRLTPGAVAVHLDAERALEPRLRPADGDLGFVGDWAGKLMGATARIALLLHIADTQGVTDDPIPESTMVNALRVADYFTEHALAAFDLMGIDPAVEGARTILDWIKAKRIEAFTRREALRGCRSFRKAAELDDPLGVLIDHGYLRATDDVPEGGGHRVTTYLVLGGAW